MKDKKGQFTINLSRQDWLIIIIVLIFASLLILTYTNYSIEREIGNSLLENVTISISYEQLTGTNTATNISTTLNGTDINAKVSVKTLFYINEKKIGIYRENSLDKIQFPYKIKDKEIDTKIWYKKYENNFKICTNVELRYKNLNFWRFIFGSSLKELKSCQTFSGTIKE